MLIPTICVMLGLALLWLAVYLRRRSGLPVGSMLGHDTADAPGPWLVCQEYQLHGRPDYLLRQGHEVIPVELKPSQQRAQPSAIIQLLAYCLLVEEHYGRPSHGLLILQTGPVRIDYTDARRAELLAILAEMRAAPTIPGRNHHQAARCRACRLAPVCREALAE